MSRINTGVASIVLGIGLVFTGLAWAPSSWAKAKDEEKENDRIQNAGTVLKEVLDVPEDIPRDC